MTNHATAYADAMRAGAHEYRDAITALQAAGLPAEFTQTGGMCAAIYIPLRGDGSYPHLLITDYDGPLEWDRRDHEGWLVGRYVDEETLEGERYIDSPDSDVDTLLTLVAAALEEEDGA